MDMVLLLARLVLAAVFAAAGLAKLADRPSSRQAMLDFGVPAAVAGPSGALLPLFELIIVLALLGRSTGWYGALGALFLLVVFLLGISVNLARGRRPDCRCFGQIASSPVGAETLVRNGCLATLAGFIVLQGPTNVGPSLVDWFVGLTDLGRLTLMVALIASTALTVLIWLVLQLLRQNGRLVLRLDSLETAFADLASRVSGATAAANGPNAVLAPGQSGHQHAPTLNGPAQPAAGLPVGSPAPHFQLPGLRGEVLTLEALLAHERPVMLLFTDPSCGPCNALMPDIGRWQAEHDERLTIAVISRGGARANQAKSAEHGLRNVLLQEQYEIADSFLAHGTPAAVVVAPNGTISSPVALGPDAIRALLAQTTSGAVLALAPSQNGGQAVQSIAARIGQPAPALNLPDLYGKLISLADFRGSATLVLFWNPGCGFCQQMLPDLKRWEQHLPPDAPKLLVVSSGDPGANRQMGLASPLVLDNTSTVMSAFGANGTPMAVLVDAQGNIASSVAAGAQAVFALAGGELPSPNGAGSSTDPAPLPILQVGHAAPALNLPDLDGKLVSLADFRGNQALVLFWNPGCGFCQQMLPELKTWETQRSTTSPRLLVVSTGSVEENRVLGLLSPIVLDHGFSTGPRFTANGTPMAVLIDAEGNVASTVVAGAQAVMTLARNAEP